MPSKIFPTSDFYKYCFLRSNCSSFLEGCFKLPKNSFNWPGWLYSHNFVVLFILLDDWNRLILICVEALLNHFDVVVWSSACLWSLHQSLQHDLFWAIQIDNERGIDFVTHQINPLSQVFIISWESINQEFSILPPATVHRLFKKSHSDFTWNNFSFDNALFN